MEKLLSVSIASYNVEQVLAETLDSLVTPTADPRLEVLVVDDGSTDGTAALALRYQQQYPGIVRLLQKPNGGYGSTINHAAQNATGRWFKTLDGDDWFDHEGLTRMLDCLETARADLLFTDYVEVDEATGRETLKPAGQAGEPGQVYPLEPLVAGLNIEMHGMAIRTRLLAQPPVDLTEHCFYTDQEYVVALLLRASTVQYLPVTVYRYRFGVAGQSTGLEGRRKHWQDLDKIIHRRLEQMRTETYTPARREMLMHKLGQWIGYQVYTLMIFPPNRQNYQRLRAFWDELEQNWPEAFARADNHTCTLLRQTHFLAYAPLSAWLRHRGSVI